MPCFALKRPYWLFLGFVFSRASNNQSAALYGYLNSTSSVWNLSGRISEGCWNIWRELSMHQWTFVFSNYSKRKQKWWKDFSNELSPSIDLLSIDLGNVMLNYEINNKTTIQIGEFLCCKLDCHPPRLP